MEVARTSRPESALIREYVWNGWVPVAVIEGGVISFVRADHIGRPAFATNDAGAVVWSATWYPFGGVRVTTGRARAPALSGAAGRGGIGVAREPDARLRSDDGEVDPARSAGADRRGERLWLCAAEPDEVDGPARGVRCCWCRCWRSDRRGGRVYPDGLLARSDDRCIWGSRGRVFSDAGLLQRFSCRRGRSFRRTVLAFRHSE
jgi:hypothetical protein